MRELYYNDYSLENAPKRNGAVALVKTLQAAGIPIYAVGSQSARQDGLAERGAARLDDPRAERRGREGQHHGARRRRPAAGDAESERRRRARAAQASAAANPYAAASPTRCSARSPRGTPTCFVFSHHHGTSSTALPSGASATATRGSTTGPCADGPAIRCCSTAQRSPEAGVRRGDRRVARPRSSALRQRDDRPLGDGQMRDAFAPVLKQSLSDKLAQRIRGMIQKGDYGQGDRLPPIMEMARAVRRRPPDDSRSAQEARDDGHRRDSPRLGRLREPQRRSARAREPGLPRHGHEEASARSHSTRACRSR